jgi:outer membrane immunogenic protein
MKKLVYSLCIATAMTLPLAPSFAADFDPPPPPTDGLRPASYDWSGMYAGAVLAAGCVYGTALESNGTTVTNYKIKGCGPNLGLLAGFNYQMENIVFGLEGGVDGMGEINADNSLRFSLDHMSTFRGRVGLAMDNTMFYGSAGVALASVGLQEHALVGTELKWSDVGSKWAKGWTVGAGIEHAVTDTLRVRAGYDYTHLLGAQGFATNCGCAASVDMKNIHQFKVGMSFAF